MNIVTQNKKYVKINALGHADWEEGDIEEEKNAHSVCTTVTMMIEMIMLYLEELEIDFNFCEQNGFSGIDLTKSELADKDIVINEVIFASLTLLEKIEESYPKMLKINYIELEG